jgi:hypothetical protein
VRGVTSQHLGFVASAIIIGKHQYTIEPLEVLAVLNVAIQKEGATKVKPVCARPTLK